MKIQNSSLPTTCSCRDSIRALPKPSSFRFLANSEKFLLPSFKEMTRMILFPTLALYAISKLSPLKRLSKKWINRSQLMAAFYLFNSTWLSARMIWPMTRQRLQSTRILLKTSLQTCSSSGFPPTSLKLRFKNSLSHTVQSSVLSWNLEKIPGFRLLMSYSIKLKVASLLSALWTKADLSETSPSTSNFGFQKLIWMLNANLNKKSKCKSSSALPSTRSEMRLWAAANPTVVEWNASSSLQEEEVARDQAQVASANPLTGVRSLLAKTARPLSRSQCLRKYHCLAHRMLRRCKTLRTFRRRNNLLEIWFTLVSRVFTATNWLARSRACCWMRRLLTWRCWSQINSTWARSLVKLKRCSRAKPPSDLSACLLRKL